MRVPVDIAQDNAFFPWLDPGVVDVIDGLGWEAGAAKQCIIAGKILDCRAPHCPVVGSDEFDKVGVPDDCAVGASGWFWEPLACLGHHVCVDMSSAHETWDLLENGIGAERPNKGQLSIGAH